MILGTTHETRASGSSGNKSEPKSNSNKSDNKSGKGSSKQKNTNSGSTQSKGSTSEQKKTTTPDLSSKLGKDRKLTPQERQRRLDNKLCLFCGASRHVVKDRTGQVCVHQLGLEKRLSSPRDSA